MSSFKFFGYPYNLPKFEYLSSGKSQIPFFHILETSFYGWEEAKAWKFLSIIPIGEGGEGRSGLEGERGRRGVGWRGKGEEGGGGGSPWNLSKVFRCFAQWQGSLPKDGFVLLCFRWNQSQDLTEKTFREYMQSYTTCSCWPHNFMFGLVSGWRLMDCQQRRHILSWKLKPGGVSLGFIAWPARRGLYGYLTKRSQINLARCNAKVPPTSYFSEPSFCCCFDSHEYLTDFDSGVEAATRNLHPLSPSVQIILDPWLPEHMYYNTTLTVTVQAAKQFPVHQKRWMICTYIVHSDALIMAYLYRSINNCYLWTALCFFVFFCVNGGKIVIIFFV